MARILTVVQLHGTQHTFCVNKAQHSVALISLVRYVTRRRLSTQQFCAENQR